MKNELKKVKSTKREPREKASAVIQQEVMVAHSRIVVVLRCVTSWICWRTNHLPVTASVKNTLIRYLQFSCPKPNHYHLFIILYTLLFVIIEIKETFIQLPDVITKGCPLLSLSSSKCNHHILIVQFVNLLISSTPLKKDYH